MVFILVSYSVQFNIFNWQYSCKIKIISRWTEPFTTKGGRNHEDFFFLEKDWSIDRSDLGQKKTFISTRRMSISLHLSLSISQCLQCTHDSSSAFAVSKWKSRALRNKIKHVMCKKLKRCLSIGLETMNSIDFDNITAALKWKAERKKFWLEWRSWGK